VLGVLWCGMGNYRTLTVDRSTATAHRLVEYDGVCSFVHGHNMKWEVELGVSMKEVGSNNMPLDFKDVSSLLDEYDHAIVLNREDPLLDKCLDDSDDVKIAEGEVFENDTLGDTIVYDGDPTCELLAQDVADKLLELEHVIRANVTVYETDKYGMSANELAEYEE